MELRTNTLGNCYCTNKNHYKVPMDNTTNYAPIRTFLILKNRGITLILWN